MTITHGSAFTGGAAGFDLAARWAGIPTAWTCEIDKRNRCFIAKNFPEAVQHIDIRDMQNPSPVDVFSFGFPCQDISKANRHATGISGPRSGLFHQGIRIIRDIRPAFAVLENVPALLSRGWGECLRSLAEIGYDAKWRVLSARQYGAPHQRERLFAVAWDADRLRCDEDALFGEGFEGAIREKVETQFGRADRCADWADTLSRLRHLDNGISRGMAESQVRALGNAVFPLIPYGIFLSIRKILEQA